MASSTPFDGTNFLTGAPDQDQPHGNDYLEHQSTRKSMEFVNNKEHVAIANDPSAANGGGEHKNGSAVAYFTSTAPTLRPDGSTALADNDIDKGRIWFDTTYDPPVMMRWNGTAWNQAGNKVLNGTYFTSVDQAGTGTVSLVKAGRDNGDTTDIAVLTDGARMLTNAAPTEDPGISNKKYTDEAPKAQMKADDVFDATYGNGTESVTHANGKIVKSGLATVGAGTFVDVVYGVAFPGGVNSINTTIKASSASILRAVGAEPKSGNETTTLTIWNSNTGSVDVYWGVEGY